jgi:UDP-GlcNAc:undecaprenyl-phosphate/decaprenyl-phosphate GlcNAc-1-phosphate transferase
VLSAALFGFASTLFLAISLTWLVRDFANARGWTFAPKSDRHVHIIPVPRIGGLAIYLSFVGAVVLTAIIPAFHKSSPLVPVTRFVGLLGPATLVFLLGLIDDLRSVSPYRKFAVQTVAAIWLYAAGFGIHNLDLVASGHLLGAIYGLPLTVLWVLLITNAFNLIDGLDGLAAGSALFSILVVLILSLIVPNPFVAVLSVALAGAIIGFLRFNFHPASIFLGDSGSLFIGFMLGALALAGSQKAPTMVAVSIPILSLGLPILDVALAVARRFLAGKPLFGADRFHIHHKLLKRGLTQQQAVLVLYGVSAVFGFLSLVLLQGRAMIALVLAVAGMGIYLGVQQLRYHEFAELVSVFQRVARRRQFLANQVAIRHACELLDESDNFASICRLMRHTLQPIGFDAVLFRRQGTNGFSPEILRPFRYSHDGAWVFSWADCENGEACWELKLRLVHGSNGTSENLGYFSLLRSHSSEPLLLDLNLLTDEFLKSLSAAVHRASSRLDSPDNRQSALAASA